MEKKNGKCWKSPIFGIPDFKKLLCKEKSNFQFIFSKIKFAESKSIAITTLAKENGLNQNYVQNGSIMRLG